MIHEVCTSLVQNAGGGWRCRLTAEATKKERKQGQDKTPEHPGQRPAWKARFWEGVVAGGRKDAWALGQPGWEVEAVTSTISGQ